jgi:signal transduction histidine kinase
LISLYAFRDELGERLKFAQDYVESSGLLFHFLLDHLPLTGLSLVEFNRTLEQFHLLAEQFQHKTLANEILESKSFLLRLKILKPKDGIVIPFSSSNQNENFHLFCLSLTEDVEQVIMLVIYIPFGIPYSSLQIEFLNFIAPEISKSIERVRLLSTVSKFKTSLRKEQSRIARYIHDTISGNLAYIKLRLDELSIQEKAPEIQTLRDLTAQTYDSVRSLLAELDPITEPQDLALALHKTAKEIGKRGEFKVQFEHIGKPKALPVYVERRILYVVREMLINVEKHAQAQEVIFKLIWLGETLTIEFSDDGNGFEVSKNKFETGHLGLRIIQEIAAELNGQFTLNSSENDGTKIFLTIPSIWENQNSIDANVVTTLLE